MRTGHYADPDHCVMADTVPSITGLTSPGQASERRKIRKGTQSCWECKRRKVKCTFAPPRGATCDRCKRRKTLCVSQEFPQSGVAQTGDGLGHVEALAQPLAQSANTTSAPGQQAEINLPRSCTDGRDHVHVNGRASQNASSSGPLHTGLRPIPNSQTAGLHGDVCRSLLAAWPDESQIESISKTLIDTPDCLHGLVFISEASSQSPLEMLQLPSPGSHPVLIARRLLLLGLYLQAIPPSGTRILTELGISFQEIMSRAVDTAHNLVTSNDELVASLIEGIECITMEGMFHNNAGSLRRSWLTMRRAMLMAQMMSLHRGMKTATFKSLEGRTDIRPDDIWFRLVQWDRYLSMMLGLPQGAPGDGSFATDKRLEGCTPMERLQRIDCLVGGRILQRDETDINNLELTQEIDHLLHKAASSVPPQWWLLPNLASDKRDGIEKGDNATSMGDQFTHYHLVARLHMPYLLRPSTDQRYEHSKIIAANASREVLTRFLALHESRSAAPYCRGIDFLAFISSTTLALAHINGHRQSRDIEEHGTGGVFSQSLAHQRPRDRGMMERTLEILEETTNAGVVIIANRIAAILRHLLDIETDAATGSQYRTSSVDSKENNLECGGQLSDGGNVLRIYIPYIGTIKIESGGVSRSDDCPPAQSSAGMAQVSSLDTLQEDVAPMTALQDSNRYIGIDWLVPVATSGPNLYESHEAIDQGAIPLFLESSMDIEEWTLQGVDIALFDSIFRGSELDITGQDRQTP